MSSSGNSFQSSLETPLSLDSLYIGIIGGTGIDNLPEFQVEREEYPLTPYGYPSGNIIVGKFAGACIAFIARHGEKHTIPPHRVPYKANLAALKSLGVRHVIATCIVGSLKKELLPGTFVVPDQFIDMTWGRDDTYDTDKKLLHLPMATPYCSTLSKAAAEGLQNLQLPFQKNGVVVVIQGPRFSTIAESRMYAAWGGDIVNMTQYPECYFARELGLCYGAVAGITDYNAGVSEDLSMDSIGTPEFEKVLTVFRHNTAHTLRFLSEFLQHQKSFTTCRCAEFQVKAYYEA